MYLQLRLQAMRDMKFYLSQYTDIESIKALSDKLDKMIDKLSVGEPTPFHFTKTEKEHFRFFLDNYKKEIADVPYDFLENIYTWGFNSIFLDRWYRGTVGKRRKKNG